MTAKEELFTCLDNKYGSIESEGWNISEAVKTDDIMRALKALEAIHQCVYDMENLFFEYLEQKTEEEK